MHVSSLRVRTSICWTLCFMAMLAGTVQAAQTITLTYWEIAVTDRMAAAEEIIAEFEKQHPNVKVDLQPLSNSGRTDRLITAVVGGQGPDVVSWWGAEGKRLAIEGFWLDINPYVKNSMSQADLNDFFPNQLAYFREGDMLFGLPQYAGSIVTLANKSLFNNSGVPMPASTWTNSEFVEISRKLTRDTSGDGDPDQYGFRFVRLQDRMGMSVKRGGGSLLLDNDMTKFGLETPESIAALEWLQGLIHTERVSPVINIPQWNFMNGKVGMEENGPWQISQAQFYNAPFELAVVEPPIGPLGKASFLGTDCYVIPATTEHPDEAYLLVEFLASRYAMGVRARVAGLQPSRRSVAQTWLNAFKLQFPTLANVNWMAFLNAAEYAEPEPYFHRYYDVWALLLPTLNRIWEQGAPVRTSIGEISGAIQAILDN